MAREAVESRYRLVAVDTGRHLPDLAAEVQAGLTATPKRLPCRFFYDAAGSRLFDAICELPEYYLTRTEHAILAAHAPDIAARCDPPVSLVELGSGSATKTRLLIDALLRRHGDRSLRYVPIDISRSALESSSAALLAEYPALEIHAVNAEYHDGLEYLQEERPLSEEERPLPQRGRVGRGKLILWLGSNIGNLERDEAAEFLRRVRQTMAPADRLLVGIDLRKDRAILEPAYDDAQGVTAQFNLNILARINRELGATFDLAAFRHRAIYDVDAGRIEMYLDSTRDQVVRIRDLGLQVRFHAGESIHTENSYKYSLAEIDALAAAAGLRLAAQWLDEQRLFSENLLAPEDE